MAVQGTVARTSRTLANAPGRNARNDRATTLGSMRCQRGRSIRTATRGPVKDQIQGKRLRSPRTLFTARFRAQANGSMDACEKEETVKVDFLVVGTGIAGLSYALEAAKHGSVLLVTKDKPHECNTNYAQGGVCAVLDTEDSVESHINDTLVAGAHLCDQKVVETVCQEGPARVAHLAELGAEFTKNAKTGDFHLAKEGGHSHPRIVHAADTTGKEIERALLDSVYMHPNIVMRDHCFVLELLLSKIKGKEHCVGAHIVESMTGRALRVLAKTTMLATGGAGQVYLNTTNPAVATGDGLAIAFRAKAEVANMEFFQFHPTSLYLEPAQRQDMTKAFLISEAVRGAGGRLLNLEGEQFMQGYDSRAELAPRDVVARSIDSEMRKHGQSHVLLDISDQPSSEILDHFPNIAATCKVFGIDITKDPIPVVPAAHYMCGGVKTGLDAQTNVPGLFACGEVACTGLHGANRLASNSLLEGLVFAHRAVSSALEYSAAFEKDTVARAWDSAMDVPLLSVSTSTVGEGFQALLHEKKLEVQNVMWQNVGIVRTVAKLQVARLQLAALHEEISCYLKDPAYPKPVELFELRNLVTCGQLIVWSALKRKESRGLHFCLDYEEQVEDERRPTVISAHRGGRVGKGSSAQMTQGKRKAHPILGSRMNAESHPVKTRCLPEE
uniref:L-aspartate oxidase n=1 Tax=Picocystis salinarum TaxID=88271 RepID=A0A7S3XEY5_9CHLO